MLIKLFSLAVTAEELLANIEYEQSHGVFATAKRLTTLPLTIFKRRNFVGDFLQAKCDFTQNDRFAVLSPF